MFILSAMLKDKQSESMNGLQSRVKFCIRFSYCQSASEAQIQRGATFVARSLFRVEPKRFHTHISEGKTSLKSGTKPIHRGYP